MNGLMCIMNCQTNLDAQLYTKGYWYSFVFCKFTISISVTVTVTLIVIITFTDTILNARVIHTRKQTNQLSFILDTNKFYFVTYPTFLYYPYCTLIMHTQFFTGQQEKKWQEVLIHFLGHLWEFCFILSILLFSFTIARKAKI